MIYSELADISILCVIMLAFGFLLFTF